MLLHEKLKDYRLILASHSPRRRQLLRDAGIPYMLGTPCEAEETYPPSLSPEQIPAFLSERKSEAYPEPLRENDILITADTVVCLEGKVLGKPKDREDAVRILNALSGKRHRVVTGATLRKPGKKHTFSVSTDVYFRPLTGEEIRYYVNRYEPFDKAGAYGIQEWIGYVGIERIEGSFYNVMGLPVQQLYAELDRFVDAG